MYFSDAILRDEGYEVVNASSGAEALDLLENESGINIILSDLKMPGMDGLELYKKVNQTQPDIPFIIMTAHGTIESAVNAMKEGVTNYLIKPLNYDELSIVLDRAIREKKITEELADLKKEIKTSEYSRQIIGTHPKLKEVFELVRTAAPTDAPILIHGETGTGKEMIARQIHSVSNRSDKPMISINSAALSETLLEDELFGHVKGAFTGAISYKKGRLESADGGTLFLDEIGFMSLPFQTKLLRFLQEGSFEPVGGTQTKHVNVRTIAATSRDLEKEIQEGRFLNDLLYRIEVISINLPPLRNRKDDIQLLVNHFINKYNTEYGKKVEGIDTETLNIFLNHEWPGNIRQLENCIARGVILSKGTHLTPNELPAKFRELSTAEPSTPNEPTAMISQIPDGGIKLKEMEIELIIETLRKCGGNKSMASEYLGISRKALYEKLDRYKIQRA